MVATNQLAFQCRRGMLELDLFLQPFLNQVYPKLTQQEQDIFAEVLSASDQQLYAWLMNSQKCPYEHWQDMIKQIRDYAIQHTYQN